MTAVVTPWVGKIPDDLTSFVGRRGASGQVKRLVSSSRLVTLTGVAGVGKSRLAVQVARDLRRGFPDGVWLVELGRLQEPELLGRRVLAGLGLREHPTRDPADVLAESLVEKRLLLVLDSCEHLIDECGRLVAGVLAGAPEVRVLATSRAPLTISGERVWPVPPMTTPRIDAVSNRVHGPRGQEALHLFADRASAVLPGFAVGPNNELAVARLCQQLDGLPLAIELAAVWMRSLSVDEILSRLADRYQLLTGGARGATPRHQTLRAAVDWSFGLCSPNERAVWTRLSVFEGGFELEAAEEVCSGEGMSRAEVFAGVAGLVEKSVLTREDRHDAHARYRLLKTIREFGWERLSGADKPRLRRRHRDHYLALAEQADAEWLGPYQVEWLTLLRADEENLWSALEFCVQEPGEGHEALRLVAALRFYWIAGGGLRDGRYWLDAALGVALENSSQRARALVISALVNGLQGDVLRGRALLHGARDLAERLRDDAVVTWCEHVEGTLDVISNDFDTAAARLSEALARERMVRPDGQVLISLANLALVSLLRGEVDRAVELCERCHEVCEEHGELWGRSWAETVLGLASWNNDDLDDAALHVRAALRLKHVFNDRVGIVLCVEILAWVAARQDQAERAARLLAAAARLGDAGRDEGRRPGWTGSDRPHRAGSDDFLGARLFGIEQYLRWHSQCESRVRRAGGFSRASAQTVLAGVNETVAYALDEPRSVAGEETPVELTRREREVAALVAEGLSNRRIAERLVIAKRTADSHIEHILIKLGFTSRAQVAAWVTEHHAELHASKG